MPTAAEPSAAEVLDITKMSRVQKLAALMIILGPETAAQILKSLSSQDLVVVTGEMARLPIITRELRSQILEEMSEVAVSAGTDIHGGMRYAQSTLEKAVGSTKAASILTRISPEQGSTKTVENLLDMEVRDVLNLIKEESMQTIALVTSYLPPNKASELIMMLPLEQRDLLIERLAALEPSPVEVMESILSVLRNRLHGHVTRGVTQTGGLKNAADILNACNKNISNEIITQLEERNEELCQAIRQKMFTFNDLLNLDKSALQKLLREVDTNDLALSLKRADEMVKNKLLGCISKRAAETVMEEIGFLGSVKLKEIEAAQLRIVEIVRRLEAEGEIDLESSDESEGT